MTKYTSITILYNPNSTGPGKAMAEELQQELERKIPRQPIKLLATKRVGHAEELAYTLAMETRQALVISASGDGGYHEVVNGLQRAQKQGAKPIAGLIPAGNANDHFHDVHDEDLAKAIARGNVQTIDLLKLQSTVGGKAFERYAHSYIGIGLTPIVGAELNKNKLNRFNEILIVLKGLFHEQPVRLVVDGTKRRYDSLIFSNVSKMSKVLKLSDAARNDDGLFEITAFRRRNKLKLIHSLLQASTLGLSGNEQAKTYHFATIKSVLIQLDGEIHRLDAGVDTEVTIAHRVLTCVV